MNTHTSYTDRYSAEEMYEGDFRSDEYEDILENIYKKDQKHSKND